MDKQKDNSQSKPDTNRKRTLVSCDRCKRRRVRCLRSGPNGPCMDCKQNGIECISKLPRKQRVYGSIETLSLRFRALEALVKGLYFNENTSDTSTLFRLAASHDIEMPAPDDYSPANIFKHQETSSAQPSRLLQSASIHTQTDHQLNSFVDAPPKIPSEKLYKTAHGISLYYGSSSSFKFAMDIRELVARCNPVPQARSLLRQSSSPNIDLNEPQQSKQVAISTGMKRENTDSSTESCTKPTSRETPGVGPRGTKRARTDYEVQEECLDQTKADFLPPRFVGDALLSAYMHNIHDIIPLFQRSIFQLRYETMYAHGNEKLNEDRDTRWLCCLALVFIFGAQVLKSHGPKE